MALTSGLWEYEGIEVDLAAHIRHTDAVAVPRDSPDDPAEQVPVGRYLPLL